MTMCSPAFRNASSRSRVDSVSKSYSFTSKMVGSGWNDTLVPRLSVTPISCTCALGHAAHVLLLVHLAVALHLDVQPVGQRVDADDADAVQTARDLVGAVLELAAGVQLGHHHVERVHARHRGVRPHRECRGRRPPR